MSDHKDSQQATTKPTQDQTSNGAAGSSQERTTYPYDTIRSSIEMVTQIVAVKGTGQYASKKEISVILAKSEGTLVTKLSSCVQYGLLVNKFNVGYVAGEVYTEFTHPVYSEDKKRAVIKMLYRPTVYKSTIDDLNGKIIPNESGIINFFKQTYKMLDNSAERAARVFQENLRYAGVLDQNMRLRVILSTEGGKNTNTSNKSADNIEIDDREPTKAKQVKVYNSAEDDDLFKLPIPLPNNRLAFLEYPRRNINKKDINVIKLAIAFIEGSLPDEEVK